MSEFEQFYVRTCIDLARQALKPLYKTATERKQQYWVGGGDEGPSYCEHCIDAAVAEARAANSERADEISCDGGWATEEDTPQHCETCGAPLHSYLTDYAVQSELTHFSERLATVTRWEELGADECYELDDALDAAQHWTPEHKSYAALRSTLNPLIGLMPTEVCAERA